MRLVAQARTAAERVAAWSPPRRIVNLQDLREPLEAVATALNASDRYETALVAHLEEVGRARSELASLRARTVESLFELQRQVVDLQTQLTDAVRVEAGVPGSADPLVRNIQALVSRAQAAQLGLRRSEAEIAVIDEKLARQETAFRDGMRFAQQARTGLYRQMIQAENAISTMVPTLFDGAAYAGPIDTRGVLQVCPVDPPNAYSDDFGAPRYAGGYHPHQGNDIFAPEGTPIRAPFPGNAVVTSNTLGGNAVSVYGAQGYVYNAHLSQFGTLGPVEAGEIIGYVGNTGDAINSPSHDHFEWHPDNGSAVDPFVYLNAVCRPAAG
jgi:murein DD-endopeptidase MepM/ murein hydrolase activator NlpD